MNKEELNKKIEEIKKRGQKYQLVETGNISIDKNKKNNKKRK